MALVPLAAPGQRGRPEADVSIDNAVGHMARCDSALAEPAFADAV